MPLYNLLQYSKSYRKTASSLWNYYRDEPNNPPANHYDADPITNSTSFKYKNSIAGKAIEYNAPRRITDEDCNITNNSNYDENKIGTRETQIIVPLRHLSNVWRALDMPFINCEVSLILTWSKNCFLTDLILIDAIPAQGNSPARPAIAPPTGATFKITDIKLYFSVVTLSAENDNKRLK